MTPNTIAIIIFAAIAVAVVLGVVQTFVWIARNLRVQGPTEIAPMAPGTLDQRIIGTHIANANRPAKHAPVYGRVAGKFWEGAV